MPLANLPDYGAVGDCGWVDKRTTGDNFGLASATPVDAATFGKGFKDQAITIPATDNTTAFRAAWDALMSAGTTSFERHGASGSSYNIGYRALREELYIPPGGYYIADAAALFSLLRAAPANLQRGITVRGAGWGNTILYVRITGSGATDWLFYDNNSFKGLDLRDLSIICTTGNERIFYHSSTGNAQRHRFQNVEIRDYKKVVEVAGTSMADRWSMAHSDFITKVAGATFWDNTGNDQSVGHSFTGCYWVHYNGGSLFNLNAGTVRIFGGYSVVEGLIANGAEGIAFKTGTLHTRVTPAITLHGHRTELRQDAGYCDLSGSKLVAYECTMGLISNTRANPHVVVRRKGTFEFNGGHVDDVSVASSNSVLSDYFTSDRSEIHFRDTILDNPDLISSRFTRYTDAGDGLTTPYDLTTAYTGSSGPARIFVDGCRSANVNFANRLTVGVNGAPFATRGYSGRQPHTQIVYSSNSGAHSAGLPAPGQSPEVQIRIPIHCELRRVVISKQDGTGAGTWELRDGNSALLATLTAASGETYKYAEANFRRRVVTDNDRTFTLTATSGGSAVGYASVEYV